MRQPSIARRMPPVLCIGLTLMTIAHTTHGSPLDFLRKSNESLRRTVLDNGLVCLVKEDHSAPVVAVQIWVGTGAADEQEYLGAGLSHYMEHMIFKGTPTRGPAEISRAIDDAGGDINAYTTQDRTVFYIDIPSKSWKTGVDVLSDAVMNSALPEDEWEREKQVILREFAMGNDDPGRVINKLLWETAYRVHPYKYPVIGHEDIFRTMTRDDLKTFFHRHYVPDNMTCVVVGDIKMDEVEAYLKSSFAGLHRRPRAPVILPAEPAQIAPRFARQTGVYNVSRLAWCYHTVSLNDPDAPALDVLASIVGQGNSSRLVRKIKDELKLVYDIDAWSHTPKDPGLFGITAVFDPTNEPAVTDAIQKELETWRNDLLDREEIEKARRMLLVGELSNLQSMSGQASSFASGDFYAGDPRFAESYLARLEALTPDQLRDVARKYLTAENRTLVVLSPTATGTVAKAAEPAAAEARADKIELANGVPLIVREDHRLPFVYISAALGGGLLTENETNNGITQLMSEMLIRGTDRHDAEDIASRVESLGASLSPFSGRNSFGLQASCLSQDIDAIMDLFADCLQQPAFPADELEKERSVQMAEIRQQREQPMFLAQEALRAMLFPGHPYRFNPTGTEESVARLGRDEIISQFRNGLKTGNLVLAIFGDITKEKARNLAEKYLDAIPKGTATSLAAVIDRKSELPARTKRREPREQAVVLVGYPGVDIKDPRLDALNVVQKSLSGLSSELGVEIREKRGLVYYVGAFNIAGIDPGLFAIYAGTREEAADQVEQLIGEQVARIARDGLTDEEWQRAREQILAGYEMSLQNNGDLAQACALNELYGLGYLYGFDLPKRLNAVTPDDAKKAAAALFVPERKAVSLVLPEKTEPQDEEAKP